jgi:hypothetical protein
MTNKQKNHSRPSSSRQAQVVEHLPNKLKPQYCQKKRKKSQHCSRFKLSHINRNDLFMYLVYFFSYWSKCLLLFNCKNSLYIKIYFVLMLYLGNHFYLKKDNFFFLVVDNFLTNKRNSIN